MQTCNAGAQWPLSAYYAMPPGIFGDNNEEFAITATEVLTFVLEVTIKRRVEQHIGA